MFQYDIAVAQMRGGFDIAENLKIIQTLTRQASVKGCVSICFPELSLTGYRLPNPPSLPSNDIIFDELKDTAKNYEIDIAVGFCEQEGSNKYITHMVITQNGNFNCYRKTHLGEKESKFFIAGDELKVFLLTCGICIGFSICIESHIPQVSETLARKGAHIIFSPHAVPKSSGSRANIWRKYIPARAYDYRVYIACCNQTGNNGTQEYEGGCFVCDPKGEIILENYADFSSFNIFTIDLKEYESYRKENSLMSKRNFQRLTKPALYL